MLNNGPVERQVDCFFNALKDEPFASGMILANLIIANDNHALEHIHQTITKASLERMVRDYHETSKSQKALLDPSTHHAFDIMFQRLLKDDDWALKLSHLSLICLGQQESYSRWALYRLLQKANPQQNISVPVKLFDETGLEHSFEAVARAYKNYQHLPDDLVELCTHPKIAHMVMRELSEHGERFVLSEALVDKYPQLALSVAHDWQHLLATNPLPLVQAEQIRASARRLALNHAAFEGLSEQNRLIRVVQEPSSTFSFGREHLSKILASGWTLINAPRIATWSHMAYAGLRGLAFHTAGPTIGAMSYSTCAVFVPLMAPMVLYATRHSVWPTTSRISVPPSGGKKSSII